MKTTIRYILLFALLALAGCTKDGEDPRYPHSSRVVLVYMAGDNSLGGYVQDNLDAMMRGMASAPSGSRTIAYVDTPSGNPGGGHGLGYGNFACLARAAKFGFGRDGARGGLPCTHAGSCRPLRTGTLEPRTGVDALVGHGIPDPLKGPNGGVLAADQA